jgi:hypothetical protein
MNHDVSCWSSKPGHTLPVGQPVADAAGSDRKSSAGLSCTSSPGVCAKYTPTARLPAVGYGTLGGEPDAALTPAPREKWRLLPDTSRQKLKLAVPVGRADMPSRNRPGTGAPPLMGVRRMGVGAGDHVPGSGAHGDVAAPAPLAYTNSLYTSPLYTPVMVPRVSG